jgi:hypothetical protein
MQVSGIITVREEFKCKLSFDSQCLRMLSVLFKYGQLPAPIQNKTTVAQSLLIILRT